MDLISFLPGSVSVLVAIVSFVVALMVIVAIHEYGHYIVGRWCGIHAEVFSLGFGPVLAHRTDRRGTRWQIAALPFGGYVKFLGDANAASATVSVDPAVPPQERRRTMLGAPVWARALTVAAGPVANFLLSFVLFAGLSLVQGKVADQLEVSEIAALPPAWGQGLRAGDQILQVDGHDASSGAAFAEARGQVAPAAVVPYLVRRGGQEVVVEGPHPLPPLASSVSPRSAASDAGLRAGDAILAIDGQPVSAFAELQAQVAASAGAPVVLTLWRAGETLTTTLQARRTDMPAADGSFETRWLIGVTGGSLFTPVTQPIGLLESAGAAVDQIWFIIVSSLSGFWHMLTGAISACNLSSPVGIAETSGAMASQGTMPFLFFVALLSTAVGLLNLLPVPVLDGGHLMFHAYEAIVGRPPSERVLRIAYALGLSAILTLMLFALANDLFLCP